MNINEIKKLLKSKDLSVTDNRIKIIQCLSDGHHFHAISEIIKHVGLNTKSVYNNIKVLIDKGLVDSFAFGGVSKYALNDLIRHGEYEIHVVNKEEIKHLEVDKKVFEEIKDKVEASGQKIHSIRILVNVE